MATIEFEIARAKARKNETGVKDGKFSGEMRTGEQMNFKEGDVLQFPAEYNSDNVRESAMGQYTFVVDQNGNAKQFWPSSFWKYFEEYVYDGENRPVATGEICQTTGNAVDAFKSHPDVDSAMQAFKNRKIKVVKAERKGRLDFNNSSKIRNTYVYQFDLVDDKK